MKKPTKVVVATKTEVIVQKLVTSGLTQANAELMAVECMAIAYQKTVSSKAQSYNEFQRDYGKTKRFEVYEHLRNEEDPQSRQEIAYDMNYKMSTICGRINELIKDGYVVVCGSKEDPETKKTVQTLRTV